MGADFYKANLKNSSLGFADLSSDTKKNGKQLKIGANLREAELKGAKLWGTKFSSTFQLKRAKNWEQDKSMPNEEPKLMPNCKSKSTPNDEPKLMSNGEPKLMPNWKKQIKEQRTPRLRIALLKHQDREKIFNAYELGMRRAANRRVKIWTIKYKDSNREVF